MPPLCLKCGKPESSGNFCIDCWGYSGNIDCIRSVFVFEGPIREAIHALKYQNIHAVSRYLADYMSQCFHQYFPDGGVLVPVPLHENRLRIRGYNQSELLAEGISRNLGVPVQADLIRRVKDNKPQARTDSLEERLANMDSVFDCNTAIPEGMDIIIIDDVCTSGATLEACATAIKKGGSRRVRALTLAREIFERS